MTQAKNLSTVVAKASSPGKTVARKPKSRRKGAGRPRDPSIEHRVFEAAMEVYSESGWAGFKFDVIARRAEVGKAAIYKRWPKREDLFRALVESRWRYIEGIDTGSIQTDLFEYALFITNLLNSNRGLVAMNMQLDARRHEEIREIAKPFSMNNVKRCIDIVDRAISRGEVGSDIDPIVVYHLIIGAIRSRVMVPQVNATLTPLEVEDFANKVVKFILHGIGAQP